MACSKDDKCLKIAESIYPSLQGEIDSSFSSINSKIDEINTQLTGLVIPDDYLGNKVKERLETISTNIGDDISDIESAKSSIESFITQKEAEHKLHYKEWQEEQERIRRERESKNYKSFHLEKQ